MKKSNFHSLRIQIILFTVIVITLSTGVVAATIIYNNYNNTVSQMKSEALSLAYSNAYLISEKAAAAARLSDIQKTLENLVETQSVAYCAIIDEQGTTLAEDDIQHVGESWAEDEDTMIVIKNKQESAEFWIDEDGLKVLDVMIPMNATVEGKKIAVMNIGISVEAMNKALMGSIIKNIVITLMMALVFSLVVLVLVDKKLILPIRRISRVADEIANGDLNASLDMECKGEIGELKESFERITGRIKEQALATQMISRGELNLSFESSSSKDVFSDSLMMLNQTIEEMLTQVHMVIRDIVNGNLNARLDDFFYQGKWKELAAGINQLISVLVEPIHLTADYVSKISHGEIPDKITEEYQGDFNEIKNNLNSCIDVMNGLIGEVSKVSESVARGSLGLRGNREGFHGSWSLLVRDINGLVDEFVEPIHLMSKYLEEIGHGRIPASITEDYEGDFNKIKTSINACLEGLSGLVEGSNVLNGMSKNDFTKRLEGSFEGIFDDIAVSINDVNDSVRKTIDLMHQIADGDLSELENLKKSGKKSEDDELVPSLIKVIENIKALLNEANHLTKAVIRGELTTRADEGQFEGEWKNLVAGMNNILKEVANPINEVIYAMNQISEGYLDIEVKGNYGGEFDRLKQEVNLTSSRLKTIIGEISHAIGQIAERNIDLDEVSPYRGDFVKISDSLNIIIRSLNHVLGEMNQVAEQVSAGSNQVSLGSQVLSQGSTEQAGAIQELSASVAEIAEQTKANAANASQASQIADYTKDNAIKGNRMMQDMLNSMKDINESSNSISKIIKAIDEIAFQTNILALNAAVEAARAGQHGKGFAVVAEEVRSLAARSAEAASETTELIENSIQKVNAGTLAANNTAGSLKEIVDGIEKSADLVKNIASASMEQADSISEVNKGLDQISIVVQNNSATAEESAASSEELSGQAEILKEMAASFRLKENRDLDTYK